MDLFKPLPNVIKGKPDLMTGSSRTDTLLALTPARDLMTQCFAESGGKFPELHAQAACVYAFNYGIKAFTFGRKAEAEQFLGMSFTLSKSCPFADKQTMAKISQVCCRAWGRGQRH
jgi:hypothetical protein